MAMGWTPGMQWATLARLPVEATAVALQIQVELVRTALRPWGPLAAPALALIESVSDAQQQCLDRVSHAIATALPGSE